MGVADVEAMGLGLFVAKFPVNFFLHLVYFDAKIQDLKLPPLTHVQCDFKLLHTTTQRDRMFSEDGFEFVHDFTKFWGYFKFYKRNFFKKIKLYKCKN